MIKIKRDWQARFRKSKIKAFLTNEDQYYNVKVHVLKFVETDESGNTIDKFNTIMVSNAEEDAIDPKKTVKETLNDIQNYDKSPIQTENMELNNKSKDGEINQEKTPEDGDEKNNEDIEDPEKSKSSCNK